MNRREQLAYVVGLIGYSDRKSSSLKFAIEFAKDNGIHKDIHVGKEEYWFDQDRDNRVSEWLMGQFITGYEDNNYIAYNSTINISMSFLNGIY